MRLVDGAIARETISGDADASNVIVLDDVTPQYLKARHALNSCGASLDAALKSLLESQTPWLTGGEDRMRCSASRSFRAAK